MRWARELCDWLHEAGPESVAEIEALLEARRRELALLEAVRDALDWRKPLPPAPEPPGPDPAPAPEGPAPRPAREAVVRTSAATLREAREKIARALREHGPGLGKKLMALTGLKPFVFYDALKCDYFEREPDGYHLTAKAYAELFDPYATPRVEPDPGPEDDGAD